MMKHKALILLCCSTLLATACSQQKNRPDPDKLQQLYANFIDRWDFNEDGSATCEDISVQRSRLFKHLDENDDGFLTSREYRHARYEDKSFMFFTLDRVDTNNSFNISLEEFVRVPHSQFLNMDKDDDCRLNKHEAMIALRKNTLPNRSRSSREGKRNKGQRHFMAPTE